MRIQYIILFFSIVLLKLGQNGRLATDVVNQSSSESTYEETEGSKAEDSGSVSDLSKPDDKGQIKNESSVQSTYADEDDEGSGELSSEGEASESEMKGSLKLPKSKSEEIPINQNVSQAVNKLTDQKQDNQSQEEESGGASLSGDFVLIDKEDSKKPEVTPEESIVPALDQNQGEGSKDDDDDIVKDVLPAEDPNVQKASDSIKDGISGNVVGHVVPTTLDVLLGVVQPTRSFTSEPQTRPLQTQFGRKRSSDDGQESKSSKYLPTPACSNVIEKFEWNKDLIGTSSQAAFKIIFGEITVLKSMTNIQAEKTITAAFDVLKDPAAEGINPQEALALYVCEADKDHGRSVYQKLIEYGYLSSLLHPIAHKMWGCVKYGHYYDSAGNNPLHLAAMSNSLQVVDFVLRLIKDPVEIKMALEEKNDTNQTPLDVAVDERRPSIIRRLKTTYRTMSNFVKKLDPEAVMEEKRKQKIMTESAALFCKPVLRMNSHDEEAIQTAIEKGREVSQIMNNYSRQELAKESVQNNLRAKRKEYNDNKDIISSAHKHQKIQPHNPIELSESILEDEVIKFEHDDDHHHHPVGLQEIQGEILDEATEINSESNSEKKDSHKEQNEVDEEKAQEMSDKGEEEQNTKPKSFLEKVLFWSIIIFCVVFTVVLLLIWFATKV
ncbi:secreted with ankyrin repeats plus transmembrane domain or GPI anchor [Cryptosporidium sp. chipmunk genotype I]|uniref:secreted with ankyrin repeats plus transmembrane domain or GPI anchor n=1 Tax=Cryptosporidium sp. chipmunk genotype I TaxID=1280935 RepID=UPI003519E811|nr:secreted with ankyrin repeats plus transmembrane domain or GPI anchor [Cryptosporidium sp. chipmunk genotype I]